MLQASRVRTVTSGPKILTAFFIQLLHKSIFHFQNILKKNQGSFYKMHYDFGGMFWNRKNLIKRNMRPIYIFGEFLQCENARSYKRRNIILL